MFFIHSLNSDEYYSPQKYFKGGRTKTSGWQTDEGRSGEGGEKWGGVGFLCVFISDQTSVLSEDVSVVHVVL